jgi:hypothetical protein
VYRAKHPSLHYHVWNRGKEEPDYEVDESFVFLCEMPENANPHLLNLLEMWGCLMLQSLTGNSLAKYLPADMIAPRDSTPLNIAIPLHQAPTMDMHDAQDPSSYHTSDPALLQHFSSLRRRFFELKFSSNSTLVDYYNTVMQQKAISRAKTNIERARQCMGGMQVFVKVTSRAGRPGTFRQSFHVSLFTFNISLKWVQLENEAPIEVRFELTTKDELRQKGPPENVYCLGASTNDPAIRLAIHIEGTDENGKPFAGWLQVQSALRIPKMNTFVEMLDGGSMLDSSKRPNRWYKQTMLNMGTGEKKKDGAIHFSGLISLSE